MLNFLENFLKKRDWQRKICIKKRSCYICKKNIQFIYSYRGRKKITSLLSRYPENDDIWICEKEFNLLNKTHKQY